MGVLNAGEDTDRHNKVIQGGSRAYAGLVILFRIISTRNSLGVANVLCSPSRAGLSLETWSLANPPDTTRETSTPGHTPYNQKPKLLIFHS